MIRHTDTNMTASTNSSSESNDMNDDFSLPKRASHLLRAFTWGTRRSSHSHTHDDSNSDNDNDNDNSNNSSHLNLNGNVNHMPNITVNLHSMALTRTDSEVERELRAEKKRQRKAKYGVAQNRSMVSGHPRDKPLTPQNLQHQALLGAFTWDDNVVSARGAGRLSIISGISPCGTRAPSISGDDYFSAGGQGEHNEGINDESRYASAAAGGGDRMPRDGHGPGAGRDD